MALKSYQQVILPDTLYAVTLKGGTWGSEQLQPSIEVIGADCTVYGSQVEPVSAPTGMSVGKSTFQGLEAFGVIPNYLYVSGAATSIVLSGVEAVEVV